MVSGWEYILDLETIEHLLIFVTQMLDRAVRMMKGQRSPNEARSPTTDAKANCVSLSFSVSRMEAFLATDLHLQLLRMRHSFDLMNGLPVVAERGWTIGNAPLPRLRKVWQHLVCQR